MLSPQTEPRSQRCRRETRPFELTRRVSLRRDKVGRTVGYKKLIRKHSPMYPAQSRQGWAGLPADCGPCGVISPVHPTLSPHLLFPPPVWAPTLVIAGPWTLLPPRRALLMGPILRCLLCSLEQRPCGPRTQRLWALLLSACQRQTPPPGRETGSLLPGILPALRDRPHSHLVPRSGGISHFFDYLL